MRAESLRLLLAPRLAALELTRIAVPLEAKIPWDFQVLKILLVGLASGKWNVTVEEWIIVAAETRYAMSRSEGKEVWRTRLRRLEELVVYGLIEGRVSHRHRSAERRANGRTGSWRDGICACWVESILRRRSM